MSPQELGVQIAHPRPDELDRNIIVGVSNAQYETAIKALYAEMTRK